MNFLDFMESKSRREKTDGGFSINRKINATIVFYYESNLCIPPSAVLIFSEPPIVYLQINKHNLAYNKNWDIFKL